MRRNNAPEMPGRPRGRNDVLAVALAAAAVVLGTASSAAAYCRTSSCPNSVTGARCVPALSSDCGVELAWKSPCIGFSVQRDASFRASAATTEQVFQAAFDTWMNADCGGGSRPRIQITSTGPVACAAHEYNQKVGNANIILFHDDGWPYMGGNSILALTTVTYNLDNGEIYDADIEINSKDNVFTTGDAAVEFDFLSIATHEAGHFLGLAHSDDTDATMFPDYNPGTVTLRELAPDDVSAICAVYPPGEAIPASCDSTPRHGFSGECSENQVEEEEEEAGGCCTVAPGSFRRGPGATGHRPSVPRGTLAIAFGGLLLALARLRRRGPRLPRATQGTAAYPPVPRPPSP